jgi:hypothetical protein
VIPEHVIVVSQPATAEGAAGYPGHGVVSPGYHVFTLTERADDTLVTVFMQHASLMARPPVPDAVTADDALAPWREVVGDGLMKWRDIFIPTLKRLVAER